MLMAEETGDKGGVVVIRLICEWYLVAGLATVQMSIVYGLITWPYLWLIFYGRRDYGFSSCPPPPLRNVKMRTDHYSIEEIGDRILFHPPHDKLRWVRWLPTASATGAGAILRRMRNSHRIRLIFSKQCGMDGIKSNILFKLISLWTNYKKCIISGFSFLENEIQKKSHFFCLFLLLMLLQITFSCFWTYPALDLCCVVALFMLMKVMPGHIGVIRRAHWQ